MARRGLIGLGVGLAAAGAATAAGIATGRIRHARTADAAPEADDAGDEQPQPSAIVVVADDGVPLHVEVDDNDDAPVTVVLVHGYAHSSAVWAKQRAALRAAGYRVVSWDLRGHGRSGEGADASYTIDQLGADLDLVLRETTPNGPAVLIGHSMGGMAIMALAEQRPQLFGSQVIGVALVSTSAGGLSGVNYGLGRRLGSAVHRLGPAAVSRVGTQQELFDSARAFGRGMESVLVHRYSFGGPVPKGVVREVAEMIFATRLQVIGAFLPGLLAHDRRDALDRLQGIETLILHGTRDRMTPIAHAQQLAEALPGAELVVVRGAGHVLPMEDPQLVTHELLAFVRRALRAVDDDAKRGAVGR